MRSFRFAGWICVVVLAFGATSPAKAQLTLPPVLDLGEAVLALPGVPTNWQGHLGAVLSEVSAERAGGLSRMPGLSGHAFCKSDPVADRLLQSFGTAYLAGQSAEKAGDIAAARKHYGQAVADLGQFARALYCLDYRGIHQWDRAIARLWRTALDTGLTGSSFDEVVQALWNPALLITDFAQMSGHSEIVTLLGEHEKAFAAALAPLRTDGYGAAWLDDFGTGNLLRVPGDAARDRLLTTLANPVSLGLGTCPLTLHAADALGGICVVGLSSAPCETGQLQDVLAMLYETGLIDAVVAGKQASGPSSAPAAAPAGGHPVDPVFRYFGTPLADMMAKACARLATLKPGGATAALALFGDRPIPPGARCVFDTVQQDLTPPGGAQAARSVQCLQQFRTGPTLPSGVQFSLPEPECGAVDPAEEKYILKLLTYLEDIEKWADRQFERAADEGNEAAVELFTDVIVDSSAESAAWADFAIAGGAGGPMAQPEQSMTVEALGGSWVSVVFHDDGESYLYDLNTGAVIKYKDEKPADGGSGSGGGAGRPQEPGSCGDTAAMQRARAIFACMFEETEVAGGVGPGPVSQPLAPGAAAPPDSCDAISPSAFWGSSTGQGAVRPLNPEDLVQGGPTILPFIPEIQGPIDPQFFEGGTAFRP